jgi:hypothetical protein
MVFSWLLLAAALLVLGAALRHRLPGGGIAGACGLVVLDLAALGAALQLGQPLRIVVSGAALGGVAVAVGFALLTLNSQLNPRWFKRFEHELESYAMGARNLDSGRR